MGVVGGRSLRGVAIADPIPYRPWRERGAVVAGEFRWRLGLRPLDLDDWLELGPDADGPGGWIAEKPGLLAAHRDTVFRVLDGIEAECAEVATAIVDHLRRDPRRERRERGEIRLDPGLHPLDAAARLVPEDLVVMVERGGRLVFGGGSVCFPNRWDLAAKLGLPLADVHRPVARLNDQLEAAVDRAVDRLTPERSFWRLGWGILDTADGYTPVDGTGAARPVEPGIADLHVRVERETLRRFPDTGVVLFTIRTYVSPLTAVLADPEDRAAITRIVEAMPHDVRAYKDLVAPVLALLSRSGSDAVPGAASGEASGGASRCGGQGVVDNL